MHERRRFLAVAGAAGAMAFGHAAAAQSRANDLLGQVILDAEARLKARLGVAILDTETGRRWQHRADERFPMCSTFKGLAGAAVLALVDGGREDLGRRIVFQEDELVTYSPVTKDRIGGAGMTIGELCEATITTSDNTAGNLVLRVIGGPDGLTRFLRSTGDAVTRLDRWETALNEARPGDPRDTTTPAAMTDTMGRLVLGDVLSASSRDRLTAWLVGNTVSGPKLKAGLPHEWRVADRTGGGGFGTNNVTGLVWPPGSRPILVSIFITETVAPAAESNAAMADLARTLHTTLAG